MIEPITLPRGAGLLAETAAGARSFAAGFWFPVGSRHEAPRERGFAHFTEHLVFKGTETRGARELARAVDRVGGWLNAFTERDGICVHCTVPASEWRLALGILVDMCFRSTFPPEEVERERGVITSEILAARDDPEEASHDLLVERTWPGHPLARRIAGEPEDVAAATRDALVDFWRGWFRPELLLATAAGPLEPAEVADELGRLLALLPPATGPAAVAPPEPEPVFAPITDFEPAPLSQVYLYEALPLRGPFAPGDWYALSVANGALGESVSSRLFQRLREREGLCYSVYSAFSMERLEGMWVAQASSSAADFPRLLEALDRELDAIASGEAPLDDEEARESVSRIAGAFEIALDDPEFRTRRLARQHAYGGGALDTRETEARIRAVGAAEARDALARLLGGRPRARFAYGKAGKAGRAALAAHAAGTGTEEGRRG